MWDKQLIHEIVKPHIFTSSFSIPSFLSLQGWHGVTKKLVENELASKAATKSVEVNGLMINHGDFKFVCKK